MSVSLFPPRTDGGLLAWSNNFVEKIAISPESVGLDAAQAAAYTVLHEDYAAKLALAISLSTNSRANIGNKNDAKQQLLYGPGGAWDLVRIVQAFPGTTNAMRNDLWLPLPNQGSTPAPIPGNAPDVTIVSTFGRIIKVRLRDQDAPDNRGKPPKVQGAAVLYHVGETLPTDPTQWIFAMNTSKVTVDVEIPLSVPAGSKVWVTAFWFNAKKQSGPSALPEFTRVADGASRMAA